MRYLTKVVHPLAKAMMYEYRDFNPKNNSDRVYQYNVQGANMPEIDSVRELGWDVFIDWIYRWRLYHK